MTADLVQFLRARLDEDEQAAQKAAALCGCHPAAPSWTFLSGDEETDGRILIADDPHPVLLGKRRRLARRWNRSYDGLFAALHIVRHDPARVLAEVDAKRRIVDLCSPPLVEVTGPQDSERQFIPGDGKPWGDDVLRLLARPHADHPDYREEWKP